MSELTAAARRRQGRDRAALRPAPDVGRHGAGDRDGAGRTTRGRRPAREPDWEAAESPGAHPQRGLAGPADRGHRGAAAGRREPRVPAAPLLLRRPRHRIAAPRRCSPRRSSPARSPTTTPAGDWTHVGIGWGVSPGLPDLAAPNYTAAAMDGLSFEDSGAGAPAEPAPIHEFVQAQPLPARLPRPRVGAARLRPGLRLPPGAAGGPATRGGHGGLGRQRRERVDPQAVTTPNATPPAGVGLAGRGAHAGRPGPLPRLPRGVRPPAAPPPRLRRLAATVRTTSSWNGRTTAAGPRRSPTPTGHVLLDCAVAAADDEWDNNAGANYRLWVGVDPVDAHVHVRTPGHGLDGPRQPADRPRLRRHDPRARVVAGQRLRRPGDRGRPVADPAGVGEPVRPRSRRRPRGGSPTAPSG